MKLNSAIGDLEEFKRSAVWSDIKRELAVWKASFKKELLELPNSIQDGNPTTASILTHIGDINGRIRTVDYLLSLPDLFISQLEAEKSTKEGE